MITSWLILKTNRKDVRMKKYRYCSNLTGELEENLVGVVKAVVSELRNYRFLNWSWKYRREGF